MSAESVLQLGRAITAGELQEEARRALASAGATQTSAAEALGVSRPVVSKALNLDDAGRYVRVLRGIVAEYTSYRISDVARYRVERRDAP